VELAERNLRGGVQDADGGIEAEVVVQRHSP
jgi:hypothetical protein